MKKYYFIGLPQVSSHKRKTLVTNSTDKSVLIFSITAAQTKRLWTDYFICTQRIKYVMMTVMI